MTFEKSQPKPVRCGCEGEAEVIKHTFHGASPSYGVECTNCHTESWQFYNTEAKAISAWNKAMSERTVKVTRKPEAFFYRCECGYGLCCEKNDMKFCPNCGGRLEWE